MCSKPRISIQLKATLITEILEKMCLFRAFRACIARSAWYVGSYLIYPRFRYQSPAKGDATARRASATRSHEPSRGTKRLFSLFSLCLSSSWKSQPSPSLPTPPPSFSRPCPTALDALSTLVPTSARHAQAVDAHAWQTHACDTQARGGGVTHTLLVG